MSFTPTETADIPTKAAWVERASSRASVVFPVPGGPQRMSEGRAPPSTARRSSRPGPVRCSWPTNSSSVVGRIRSASGARAAASRSLAWPKRSIGGTCCSHLPARLTTRPARCSKSGHEMKTLAVVVKRGSAEAVALAREVRARFPELELLAEPELASPDRLAGHRRGGDRPARRADAGPRRRRHPDPRRAAAAGEGGADPRGEPGLAGLPHRDPAHRALPPAGGGPSGQGPHPHPHEARLPPPPRRRGHRRGRGPQRRGDQPRGPGPHRRPRGLPRRSVRHHLQVRRRHRRHAHRLHRLRTGDRRPHPPPRAGRNGHRSHLSPRPDPAAVRRPRPTRW